MKERRQTRSRVFKGATIIPGVSHSGIPCAIRNQSPSGAELKVSAEAGLPRTFQLYVPVDGVAYDCILRWRRTDKVGVEFVGRAPKPKLQY